MNTNEVLENILEAGMRLARSSRKTKMKGPLDEIVRRQIVDLLSVAIEGLGPEAKAQATENLTRNA